jgi:HK97 gp10 family phage protein
MSSGWGVTADFEASIDEDAAAGVAQKTLGPYSKSKAEKILEISQDLVPVDTGDLKASGHIREAVELSTEGGWQIIYDVPVKGKPGKWASYAIFPEMGTVNMSAEPYLRPAIDQAATD